MEILYFLSAEDLRQCNDKLVEVNSSKMALQMKLDELEAAEVNIKVCNVLVWDYKSHPSLAHKDLLMNCFFYTVQRETNGTREGAPEQPNFLA